MVFSSSSVPDAGVSVTGRIACTSHGTTLRSVRGRTGGEESASRCQQPQRASGVYQLSCSPFSNSSNQSKNGLGACRPVGRQRRPFKRSATVRSTALPAELQTRYSRLCNPQLPSSREPSVTGLACSGLCGSWRCRLPQLVVNAAASQLRQAPHRCCMLQPDAVGRGTQRTKQQTAPSLVIDDIPLQLYNETATFCIATLHYLLLRDVITPEERRR